MRKRIVFGTLSMFLLINILTLPLVDAGTKTDSSPTYGVYDRLAAYNYAQKYWDEVCSDGYFVNTRTTFIPLDPGTDITGMTGYDCAHFVSCCIGNEPHEPGGGLDVPSTALHIYGELGATRLGNWLISSGNGVEKTAISELMMGDIINYDWDGDGHWDHAALYLGGSEVAGHTTCVWEADWQLIGAANYRFVHILSAPWIVDDDGLADFHTIQEAINVASDGDTIFVRNGTYYENVIVNRSVSLIGGKQGNTIVEATESPIMSVMSDNVTITGFRIKASFGWQSNIELNNVKNCNISGNHMTENGFGVKIDASSCNIIADNTMANNEYGIWLSSSHCNNNLVTDNHISSNGEGIRLANATGNFIYHNDLINNTEQVVVYITESNITNTWDNGYPSGGNYWSDYTGIDLCKGPCQNLTGSDGIGDTPLVIDTNNTDIYPLMGPWSVEGENVTVTLSPELSVTFGNITSAGITWVNITETGPDPPSGFKLAEQYYDIETSANYSGKITIAIIYDDSNMTQDEEEALRLMQWNETSQEWVDITTQTDMQNNMIYGETSHLSLFGAFIFPINVDITCSKAIVGQGYNVQSNVTITNNGEFTKAFNVTLNANMTILATFMNITLTSGNSTTFSFTWNTTSFMKGNYTISVTITLFPENINFAGGWVFVTIPGDVDGDRDVDIYDVVKITGIYNSERGDPQFNPNSDLDCNGKIQIYDVVMCTSHYGQKDP